MSLARANLIVSGRVQGVGYRYFCYRRAIDLGITGTVQNKPNGDVSLVVEGDKSTIENLKHDLERGAFGGNVTGVEIDWLPYVGEFDKFEIIM